MWVIHTEISRVPCVRSKMSSLPSPDALFVSRKRRSYQVSFSREEADSERSFELRNDLSKGKDTERASHFLGTKGTTSSEKRTASVG